MRILLTNNALDLRAGTESYLADIGRGLRRRGHQVTAYSPVLGEVAMELRRSGLPVTDNLANLPDPPDVIHGQHHLETMSALLAFPSTPAIYTMHGTTPWEEQPPQHPRILRHMAVCENERQRLVVEHGIPPDRTGVTRNAVDLARFQPRDPLPERPRRALVLGHEARPDGWVATIRAACEAARIELDVAGAGAGKPLVRPWEVLGQYDLVFGHGRVALEALAVGCAVVICGNGLIGPLATTRNYDKLVDANLASPLIATHAVSERIVAARIAEYDPTEAAAISRQVRETADLEGLLDQLEQVYQAVVDEFRSRATPVCRDDESRWMATYLAWLSPYLKGRANERDTALNELLAYARSLELDRDERAAALKRERAERDASLNDLLDYVRSLESERDERQAAIEQERTEHAVGLDKLTTYVRSLERDREEREAAIARERTERQAGLDELLHYVRSLERDRAERSAELEQLRASARDLERTLQRLGLDGPQAGTRTSLDGTADGAAQTGPAAPPEPDGTGATDGGRDQCGSATRTAMA